LNGRYRCLAGPFFDRFLTFSLTTTYKRFQVIAEHIATPEAGFRRNFSSISSTERQWLAMAETNERLGRLVLEARRSAEIREQGYRAQASVNGN